MFETFFLPRTLLFKPVFIVFKGNGEKKVNVEAAIDSTQHKYDYISMPKGKFFEE